MRSQTRQDILGMWGKRLCEIFQPWDRTSDAGSFGLVLSEVWTHHGVEGDTRHSSRRLEGKRLASVPSPLVQFRSSPSRWDSTAHTQNWSSPLILSENVLTEVCFPSLLGTSTSSKADSQNEAPERQRKTVRGSQLGGASKALRKLITVTGAALCAA